MNYYPQFPGNNSNLIQQAAFDYLNNTFSKNPAQPLNQPKPGQPGGGGVQQPPQPQNNIGKATGIASLLGGGGAGGAGAAAGF